MILLLLQLSFSILGTIWFVLVDQNQLVMKILFSTLVFIGLNILYLLFVLLLFIVMIVFFSKKNPEKAWKHLILGEYCEYVFQHLFRSKMIVSGLENIPTHNKFVVFANHSEYTDPIYMLDIFRKKPLTFISKESLFKPPLVRHVLTFIGCVPISRKADRTAMQAIINGIKVVESGMPMAIFPEGTRSHGNQLNDFKPGAFKLATRPEATIVPICLYGLHQAKPKFRLKRAIVKISILSPIEPESYKNMDTNAISELVQSQIQAQMTQFSQE
ncbi:MAG: lysophospholipid acyltransferase family protein [Candidatus Izemoplasmatales bacterium]|jgi:1-acyl-sn-glycerol-3-phosphate acyltransferase|nr:lysophospholipid acyltransferase family protein [bacterium]MDZ4197437.1 lysophospholipid acyltransferase family protein [Candidatus Izemoplasmatales bacterium]